MILVPDTRWTSRPACATRRLGAAPALRVIPPASPAPPVVAPPAPAPPVTARIKWSWSSRPVCATRRLTAAPVVSLRPPSPEIADRRSLPRAA